MPVQWMPVFTGMTSLPRVIFSAEQRSLHDSPRRQLKSPAPLRLEAVLFHFGRAQLAEDAAVVGIFDEVCSR